MFAYLSWLPPVVAVAAGTVFVFGCEAPRPAKLLVVGTIVSSFLLQYGMSSGTTWTIGLVLQVVVGVAVLVYFKIPS